MRFVVLFGPDDGTAPTVDDEVDYLDVQSITLTAGGSRQNSLTCRYNLAKLNQHIEDTTAPVAYGRQIEVRMLDEDGEPNLVAMWGFITAPTIQTGWTAESLNLLARIEPWHFGDQLVDHRYWDEDGAAFLNVQRPCVINPEIDGVVIGNRHLTKTDTDRDNSYVFIDPEQLKTTSAQTLQAHVGEPVKWKPSEIVHWLCQHLNNAEEHILCPTLAELREAFGAPTDGDPNNDSVDPDNLDTVDQLKNVALPYGSYLPDLLDIILRPLSMGWYLDFAINDDGDRETRIRFYRRGYGDLVKIRMQRIGEALDLKKSDIPDARLEINIAELANRIQVRGGRKRFEVTVPLKPAWKEADDNTKLAATEYDPDTIQTKPYVGRKYALNEAGDYTDPFRATITGHYDLRDILGENSLIIRRRFFPCLTTKQPPDEGETEPAEESRSLGYWLEFWDRNYIEPADVENDLPEMPATDPAEPTDPGWRRVRSQFSALDHECGILFDRPQGQLWRLHQEDVNPPAEWTPGDPAYDAAAVPDHPGLHLRITCCIEADDHLEHIAARRASSPNSQDVTLFLAVPDKFHYRQVHETSIFYDDTGLNANAADEVDDTDKIEAYAEKIQSAEDAALVSCSITLPGCDHADLTIGKLIEKLDGREISLNANAPDDVDVDPRRLQIVGFNVTLNPEQKTELLLESFKEERT